MITLSDVTQQLTGLLAPLMHSPRLLMAMMTILLLIVGTVMDLTPTILILGPVLTPIAIAAGIDPLYFGVMFVLIGTLGLIHPPVCTVLNTISSIARISLERATVGVWPFLLAYIVIIVLMIIFPQIITVPSHLLH
jgi:TRAP-type C4-dicarboxylate transport system permease large subunit